MSRINTNTQSMLAQRVLGMNNRMLGTALERLSTGLRISRGRDDPAGLIAAENLRSEERGLHEAIKNAERADQVVNIAEGALQEVSSLLLELQGLVTSTASRAGQSVEERNANQLQVDSILQTIDRLAATTNFQGIKLLNGNFDFRTSGIATGVSDVRVGAAKFSGSSLTIDAIVTQSAQQAGLFLSAGGSAININTGSSLVIEIAGSKGSRELSFSSGTTLTKIRDAINAFTDVTGLEATVSGTGILIKSAEYGSSEFVSVRVINAAGINSTNNGDGTTPVRGVYNRLSTNFNANNTTIVSTFANATNAVRDTGQDVRATVNGYAAIGKGRTVRTNTDFLDVEFSLSTSVSQTIGAVGGSSGAFTIAGGGAQFQLGSKVDIGAQATLGLQDIAVRKLGNSVTGYLSSLRSGESNNLVDGNVNNAQKIVAEVIRQVSGMRGRLGSFQKNVIGATMRSLATTAENTAAAASIIRDADFAAETASLTRSQILVNAATNVLAYANQAPNSALSLLR
jgi:flagellin